MISPLWGCNLYTERSRGVIPNLFRTFAFTLLECQHEKERFARKENTLTEKDGGKYAILFRTQKQSKTGEEKSGETRTLY
jgi:hypothetical protein